MKKDKPFYVNGYLKNASFYEIFEDEYLEFSFDGKRFWFDSKEKKNKDLHKFIKMLKKKE